MPIDTVTDRCPDCFLLQPLTINRSNWWGLLIILLCCAWALWPRKVSR
jgi:hypothetical protein